MVSSYLWKIYKGNIMYNWITFKYFQLNDSIPNYLKRKAQATGVINRSIFEEWDTFYLSEKQTIS